MKRMVLSVVAAVVLSACNHTPNLAPPDIRAGQDTCHECGMIISEGRHAAAMIVVQDGLEHTWLFDDTGELLEFELPANTTVLRRYVHDQPSGAWIDASTAHFVKSAKFKTPMGTNTVAYATKEAADAAAKEHGGELVVAAALAAK